ncbi:choice-of-anchor Q domain-containing protein [Nevskia ramosa]|uniref:choice-of-anchor Q domain-containing protein n=1 Tax=Nevskia ramosa TaxID=64002 RepID=UPI00235341CF
MLSRNRATLLLLAVSALPAQAATLTPTTTADDGSAGALRQVVAAAVASAQDDVIPLNGQTYVLTQGQLTVSGGGLLRFQGPGTIQRDANAGDFRILAVNSGQTVELDQLTITGGQAGQSDFGGGIVNNGTLRISASTISGNRTTRLNGGGIYNNAGNLSLSDSTVTGNMANFSGGGVYNNYGQASLIRSTVSYNTTGGNQQGGGITTAGGTLTLSDSTVTRNTSGSGCGIYVRNQGTLNLNRSLIAGNTASSYGRELAGSDNSTINANNYNLIGYGGDAGLSLSQSSFNGTFYQGLNSLPAGTDFTPSQGIDQILNTTLASNGGPTQTHALVANSPAINAVASGCPAGATDQRGVPRPASSGCDVGAFEFSASYVVNSTADTDDVTCDAGNCTLREAINAANATAGVPEVISFNLPGGGTILLGSTLPVISASGGPVTISGPTAAADAITLSGGSDPQGANNVRLLEVADQATLNLDHLALINGLAGGSAQGGAITVLRGGSTGGTLNLSYCRLSSNRSASPEGRSGGAIAATGFTTLTVGDSAFINNASTAPNNGEGGAINAQGASLSVTRSLFSGNSAPNAGGAIRSDGGQRNPVISNSTFVGNQTGRFGGGAITHGGDISLLNNSFVNNSAGAASGGALSFFGGQATLINNLFAGNTAGQGANCTTAFGGSISDAGGNLATDGSCNLNQPTSRVVTAAQLNLAPALADNGGPTQTLALQSGSVAIDAAVTSFCTASPVNSLDQRGIARPQGTACDVGAFEARQGNLQAIKTASTASIRVGDPVSFTLTARNLAATADTAGTLTDTVPSRLRIDSVTQNNSLCTTNGQTVSCLLPTLAQNDVATISIATTALSAGDASNTATVKTGADVDNDPSNDSSTAPVTVTAALDTTPDAFSFPSKTNVARGSYQLSDEVTLTGIEFPTPLLVENGFASINGGACNRVNDPVAPGDRLRLCHTASSAFAADTVTKVTVGSFQTTFTSTTEARDITPAAFSFTDVPGTVEPGSAQTSDAITVSGVNDTTPFSVIGGKASLDGLPCDPALGLSSGMAGPAATITVCHLAGPFGSVNDTTLTLGADGVLSGVSDTFTSNTRAVDTTPEPFSFPAKTGVARGSYQLSDEVTLSGIEFPTPFLVENGAASINGGACERINDPVAPGDRLRLCHTASASFATNTVTTVTVGTYKTTFTSTTVAAEQAPAVSLDMNDLHFGRGFVVRFREITLNTTSEAQVVTLTNTGNAPLSIGSIVTTGDFKHTTTCGTTVAPSGQCTISIVFKPTAIGTRTGETRIASNATTSPDLISLSGTGRGLVPAIKTNAPSYDFGNVKVGATSPDRALIITSSGTGPLEIRSISVSGDYSGSHNCPRFLDAGKTCTLTGRFKPKAKGSRPSSVTITTSAPNSPTVIPLSGNGT